MQETWLRTNRRILLLGMILPGVLVLGGLIVAALEQSGATTWLRYVGFVAAGLGLALFAVLVPQLARPRLAYADGQLLVYVRAGQPFRVPVQIVECFFMGAGAGQLPGATGQEVALRNLVVRLAEKATDYHHRDVKPAFGRWDEGYIVLHGAWCEPLHLEVVKRMNARLAEVQRMQHEAARAEVV